MRAARLVQLVLACVALLFMVLPSGSGSLFGAEPVLRQVLPRGAQRGTDASVRLHGDRLADAVAIVYYTPGLETVELKVVDAKKVDATIRIAPDCRLGEHSLRVRTRSGLSSFFTFWVGPYPTVKEKEPNSSFQEPQPVAFGVTVEGFVDNEDVDHFVVEAKRGDRITAEVEGIRLGGVMFDPYLAILDARRFELSACDDSALLVQDPVAGIVAPEDGRYVIQLRSASYRGSKRHRYRLHVGHHPRPLVAFPPGGKAGDTVELRMIGDPTGDLQASVVVPHERPRSDRVGEIFIEDAGLTPPSGNSFRISPLPNVLETEPNDNRKKPQSVVEQSVPFALNGIVEKVRDNDWYRFKAEKNVTYDLRVFARRVNSPLDSVIHVFDGNGKYLAGNDDSNGPDSYLRWKAPASAEFLLRVRDHLQSGGAQYVYRLEVTRSEPKLSVTLPQVRRYAQDRQAIAVPRGNRFATLIRANRQNFGGPLTFSFDGITQGVTVDHEAMANSQTTVPVVFEAAPDAPLGATVVPVKARHVDSKRNIEGPYYQSADFVRAEPNNTIYYRGHVDALAVAVTEEAPFALRLEEPAVPLVRGGGMNLRVIAERREGFDGSITLNMLFSPPGVGAARNVKIAKGKNEGRIWINANERAELREWKIVVIGTASVAGPLTVSTQLATLRVEERHVDVAVEMTAVERGKPTEVVCKVGVKKKFSGKARAQLVGLPAHCTTREIEFESGVTELVFPIETTGKSPIGRHKTLFVRTHVPNEKSTILHHSPGRVVLRIDPPAKKKIVAQKPKPKPKPADSAADVAAKKEPRLSRLEKLRKEHAARKEAANDDAQSGATAVGDDAEATEATSNSKANSESTSTESKSKEERSAAEESAPVGKKSAGVQRSAATTTWRAWVRHGLLAMTAYLVSVPVVEAEDPGRAIAALHVYPNTIELSGGRDRQSIVAQARLADGTTVDVTAEATMTLAEPVAKLDGATLTPLSDGQSVLIVEVRGERCEVPVVVTNATVDPPIRFGSDVMPIFMKAGCNSGSCHGAARGKDGFRLSLFGYDPAGDYDRITREFPGRRVDVSAPRGSLLVEKAVGAVPHTGGQRFVANSELCSTLVEWIEAGAPSDPSDLPIVVGIELTPTQAVIEGSAGTQQLVAVARYSDGSDRDISSLAAFFSSDDSVAKIDGAGLVTAGQRGEAFVMARFDTFTVGSQILVVPADSDAAFPDIAENNYVDTHVYAKLRKLRYTPSELCSDSEFLRRATIDIIGQLPTVADFEQFCSDSAPDKRERLVDELLSRKEFVELWVMKFAELLQIRSTREVSYKATLLYFKWLEEKLASNVPMNEIVRELLGATGGTFKNPATNYYQIERDTLKVAENVAQVFLGMRVQCAQCHNHPFDRWTQNDYYGFVAFFGQIGRKKGEDPRETIVYNRGRGEVKHPVTKRDMPPKFLGGAVPNVRGKDRRQILADWITASENPFFAKNLANVVWAHFFGRGIVEQVDDVRVSNPPSNPELLGALSSRFTEYRYDFKKLVRDICVSRTYQLATRANDTNRLDRRDFSKQSIRRIRAEVLLDCVTQVTDTQNKFPGLPLGARAVQIADGRTSNYFLTTFGRATRETVCSCEVKMEPNLSQALHLLNGETVDRKIREGKLIPTRLAEGKSARDIVSEIYVRCFAREPDDADWAKLDPALTGTDNTQEVLEDIFWAVLNSKEFIFNH